MDKNMRVIDKRLIQKMEGFNTAAIFQSPSGVGSTRIFGEVITENAQYIVDFENHKIHKFNYSHQFKKFISDLEKLDCLLLSSVFTNKGRGKIEMQVSNWRPTDQIVLLFANQVCG